MPPSTDYPRRRSRSPHRPSKSGGFRWKSKPTDDEERRRHRRDSRRDRSRSRSRRRRSYSRSRSPPRRFSLSPRRERDRSPRRFSEERRDGRANGSNGRKKDGHRGDRSPPPPKLKEKKNKPAAIQQEMIVVNVNDRLGTKTAIPCLASDPVGLFKAQVAARIGRKPHEIMLKRQGERPFKDQLTLEDYGVSNGVQLDLEVDTGD